MNSIWQYKTKYFSTVVDFTKNNILWNLSFSREKQDTHLRHFIDLQLSYVISGSPVGTVEIVQ